MIYLAIINIVTLIVYGVDKLKAKRHQWRIPESTLILLAVIGGSIGALLGMKIWHHKTKHKKFKYGIPIILALQLALAVYIMYSTFASSDLLNCCLTPKNTHLPPR